VNNFILPCQGIRT